MKLRILLFGFFNVIVINALLAVPPAYQKTPDGVIVYTDPLITGTSGAVKLEVITDNIRASAAPEKEIIPSQEIKL